MANRSPLLPVCLALLLACEIALPIGAIAGSPVFDLSLGLEAEPETAISGGEVTLLLTAANTGPNPVVDTTFELATPEGTTYSSAAAPGGQVIEAPPPGGTGNIVILIPGQLQGPGSIRVEVELTVTAEPDSTIVADATVTADDAEFDTNPDNNAANLAIPVEGAPGSDYDLSLELFADPDPAPAGSQVTLALTATNAGPDAAVDTTFELETPEFTTFESIPTTAVQVLEAPAQGATGAIRCRLAAALDADEVADLEVVFNVTGEPGDTILFDAAVTANLPESDANPDDNASSIAVPIPTDATADVAVEIFPFGDEAASRTPFGFAVDVTNLSEDDAVASGVAVAIDVPLGTSFSEVSIIEGECSAPDVGGNGTIVCVFDEIGPGETVSVEVEVKVDAAAGASILLFAEVETASEDPDLENNEFADLIDVVAGPPATLDWDEPDPASPLEFPPPRSLVTNDAGARAPERRPARRGTVIRYNVYGSAQPGVVPSQGGLLTSVGPTVTTTTLPAAPSGTFYVVTAVYDNGESGPSNETSAEVPAATITNVKVKGAKITATGSAFTDVVDVFVDGIPFAGRAKVKAGRTKVVQKGTLLTGQTISAYLAQHPSVLITFRNSNGGVSAYRYPQ